MYTFMRTISTNGILDDIKPLLSLFPPITRISSMQITHLKFCNKVKIQLKMKKQK